MSDQIHSGDRVVVEIDWVQDEWMIECPCGYRSELLSPFDVKVSELVELARHPCTLSD